MISLSVTARHRRILLTSVFLLLLPLVLPGSVRSVLERVLFYLNSPSVLFTYCTHSHLTATYMHKLGGRIPSFTIHLFSQVYNIKIAPL